MSIRDDYSEPAENIRVAVAFHRKLAEGDLLTEIDVAGTHHRRAFYCEAHGIFTATVAWRRFS